jgi:serine/threonine protein kinase
MEQLEPGAAFGPYAVEGLVAAGGMGQVYAARHDVYGSVCALKILHAHLHGDAGWRARFNEEGVIGTQLKHPHVLSARELVEHDGRIAIVMDLVKGGQTLEKVMAREYPKGLSLVAGLQAFLSITQGIDYLHGKGIVHGDLKPENVMIEGEYRRPETWRPKVTDFGTVGLIAHPVVIDGRTAVVATPRYASPEHLRGVDQIEVRSDVYCLGLILHFLLSGTHCSDARTVREAAMFVLDDVPLVNLVDQPDVVLQVFRKATAQDPANRYANCRELALAVRKALDALGVTLDLEDVAADLATEVDEDRAALQRDVGPRDEPDTAEPTESSRPTEIDHARREAIFDAPPVPPASLESVRPPGPPYGKGSDSEVTLEPDEAPSEAGLDPDPDTGDSVVEHSGGPPGPTPSTAPLTEAPRRPADGGHRSAGSDRPAKARLSADDDDLPVRSSSAAAVLLPVAVGFVVLIVLAVPLLVWLL